MATLIHMPSTVRSATKDDLPQLAEMGSLLARLQHEVDPARFMFGSDFERGYLAWFDRELERSHARISVADSGNNVLLGFAYARLGGPDFEDLFGKDVALIDLFVRETARKSAIGDALVDDIRLWAAWNAAPRVLLLTGTTVKATRAILTSVGVRSISLDAAPR